MNPNKMSIEELHRRRILATQDRKKINESRSGVLGEGWKYYPDVSPGVGIVLLSPSGNKSYHATQEQLVNYYNKIKGE